MKHSKKLHNFTFKAFLESLNAVYIIILSSSIDVKKALYDNILNTVIGDKNLIDFKDAEYKLKINKAKDAPVVLCANDKLKPIHTNEMIKNLNKSVDNPNTPDNIQNDFKISELKKYVKLFSSENQALSYINANKKQLIQSFVSKMQRDLNTISIIRINEEDGETFKIVNSIKMNYKIKDTGDKNINYHDIILLSDSN